MATEPTSGPGDAPDRHPDVDDGTPDDDTLLPDHDVASDPDEVDDDAIDEAATEHAMADEVPDDDPGSVGAAGDGYAANSPAVEAGGAVDDAGEADVDTPGSSQAGRGPLEGDPPDGTDQPVAEDRVSGDEPLGDEARGDLDDEPIDGIDPVDDDVDRVTDPSPDETAELSADVRAIGGVETPQAFDDSSSVVESDTSETGVEESASDGGDEHRHDEAVEDLPDDADGIESPER